MIARHQHGFNVTLENDSFVAGAIAAKPAK
jgi:hypothetical protein